MKNVFGDSSDSDSEPETALPPPKRFRSPSENDVISKENGKIGSPEQEGFRDMCLEPPAECNQNNRGVDTYFFDDSCESSDEDFNSPRGGVGARHKVHEFNAKASLSDSILDENSIGYKIMEQMGFKPGQTIGASDNRSALVEPLSVRARPTRIGIGSVTFKPAHANEVSSESALEFHEAIRGKHRERNVKFTIVKLQKFCFAASGEDADLEQGILAPNDVNALWREIVDSNPKTYRRMVLFGKDISKAPSTTRDDSEKIGPAMKVVPLAEEQEVKLAQLIQYARESFHYCPFCGIAFEDDADLTKNCPGDTEQVHQL